MWRRFRDHLLFAGLRAPRAVQKIAIVSGAPVCRNPRVLKEASALASAGYGVAVLGPAFSDETSREDALLVRDGGWVYHRTVDLRAGHRSALWHRLRRKVSTELVARTGFQTPHALGYALTRTLEMARELSADLYIGHQEVGLWVVDRLTEEGVRVGVDLEDWYSEDLLPEARVRRPAGLLRRMEASALRRGCHVTTTSRAMARAFVGAYGGAAPTVVYNAFRWADRARLDGMVKDRRDPIRPSLHWVSQTIGSGRGLEVLFKGLSTLSIPVDLHLRGASSVHEEGRLRRLFPWHRGHRLFLHPPVPVAELLSRIAEHDIGLALEPAEPANKQLTVSNKMLHYLLGGLAVIATETAGQREIAEAAPGAVLLCGAEDPEAIARALEQLLSSSDALARAKAAALEAARVRFCWERQEPVLLESIRRAIGGEASCGAS